MKCLIHSSRTEKPFLEIGCNHYPRSRNFGPKFEDAIVTHTQKSLASQHNYDNTPESITIIHKHKESHIWQCHLQGKRLPIHSPPSSLEKIMPHSVMFYFSSEISFRNHKTRLWKEWHCFSKKEVPLLFNSSDACVESNMESTLSLRHSHKGDVMSCPQGPFPAHKMVPGSEIPWNSWRAPDQENLKQAFSVAACFRGRSSKYYHNQLWPSKSEGPGAMTPQDWAAGVTPEPRHRRWGWAWLGLAWV